MVNRSFDEVFIGDTDLGNGRDPVDLDGGILGSDCCDHRPCCVTPFLAHLVVVARRFTRTEELMATEQRITETITAICRTA